MSLATQISVIGSLPSAGSVAGGGGSHTHAASDIASGSLATARLADGTATAGYAPISDGDGTSTWGAVVSPEIVRGNLSAGNKTVSGTETMTANGYWDTLTIPTGTTLITNGYTVCANKIVIEGTGKLSNSGNNAGAVNHYDQGAARTAREVGGSSAGGVGVGNSGSGAGMAGTVGNTLTRGYGGVGGAGGASGAGSGGAGAAGGAAGPISTALAGAGRLWSDLVPKRSDTAMGGGSGGGSGASGGSDGVSAWTGGTSAGGGGGGGVLAFACGELDISTASAGCIQAKGGNSVNASTYPAGHGTTNSGGAGGSGGGGGGYIFGIIGKITGTLSNAIQATGGDGGSGGNGNGGSSAGGTGGTGGAGGNIDVFVCSTRTWLYARGSAGSAGSAPSGLTGGSGGAGGACSLSL